MIMKCCEIDTRKTLYSVSVCVTEMELPIKIYGWGPAGPVLPHRTKVAL